MTDIQRLADQGPVQKILPCKYCKQHCYAVEESQEGVDWHNEKDGSPASVFPDWVDTFRFHRTCDYPDDFVHDDEFDEDVEDTDQDDHRTPWTHSMKRTIANWNKINQ